MTPPARPTQARLGRIARFVRASDWWDYKLVPILAVFYVGANLFGISVAASWPILANLLGALIAGAAYVSLVNDWTDRDEDRAAGKPNRLADRSALSIAAAIAITLGCGAALAVPWRDNPAVLTVYGAAWVAFTLYSLPPIRLKARALAGIVADAAGANLFPGLLAALLVPGTQSAGGIWIAAAGCWISAYGIRGILWHQLVDREADRASGTATFVQRHGAGAAIRLAKVLFPIEIGSFALLLWLVDWRLLAAVTLIYAVLATGRVLLFQMRLSIVLPLPRAMLLPQECYDLLVPIALLIRSAAHHPLDLLALAVHLLLFPARPVQFARDVRRLLRRAPEWRRHVRARPPEGSA